MAEYPASPKPQLPLNLSVRFNTITSSFDSGKEQRRRKELYAKYDLDLTYNALSAADFATLWNFYNARGGSYEAFYFYTLVSTEAWTGLFVGTGDGSTVTFDIPGKSTSSQAIYVNGVVVAEADYTMVVGGGTESSDRVTFDTAPALNDIITCNFTGYMRIRCRFADDSMGKEGFGAALYRTGIKLKGLSAS